MLDFASDNSFETTAYALKALANLDPKSDLLPRAARWLMEHRSDGYYWDSTEQTATAIYGLIDYLKISGELKPNYTLSVYLNGQKLADRSITEKDVANPFAHCADGCRTASPCGGKRSADCEIGRRSALLVGFGILLLQRAEARSRWQLRVKRAS